jgi:hypothetical protein
MEYTPLTMTDPLPIYLAKAEESLRGAESEFVQGCYINRLLELQIDEGLAVYVVPVRRLARVQTS